MKSNNFKLQKRALLFSVFLICNLYSSQKILRFSDNKEYESIVLVENDKQTLLHKNEIMNHHFSENSKLLFEKKLVDFTLTNDTLTFFDQIKEIEEVAVEENSKKQKVRNTKIKKRDKKVGLVSLVGNCRTAFLVKFDASEKTFIESINFIINDRKDFDKNLGKLKVQILENNNNLPDDSAPLLEFEKNVSDFNLKFNNYLSAKMQIKFPRKIKYPKDGFFVVMEYVAPKFKDMMFEANKDDVYWFYPKEMKWKYVKDFPGFYYTLGIVK